VAYVDARRARLHADGAVDAVPQSLAARIDRACPGTARLAAKRVVSDDERIAIEHHALEARIWAHVLADLLAQEAGIAVCRAAVEQDPERLPPAEVVRQRVNAEVADRSEVPHERVPRPQRDG